MNKRTEILYAGDGSSGGAARYLLAILKSLNIKTVHLPSSKILVPGILKKNLDAIILSDFSRKNTPPASEKAILKQVGQGAGLLMVGGWASFSGPYGGWKGSLVEKILPVRCASRDDRLNFPGGASICVEKSHSMFGTLSFKNSPVLVGANDIRPKKDALVLLRLRKILAVGKHLTLDPVAHPLLVTDADPDRRIAAFASDFAPHWAGGMLDWGKKTVKLALNRKIHIEVGDSYVRFISLLIRWLARMDE